LFLRTGSYFQGLLLKGWGSRPSLPLRCSTFLRIGTCWPSLDWFIQGMSRPYVVKEEGKSNSYDDEQGYELLWDRNLLAWGSSWYLEMNLARYMHGTSRWDPFPTFSLHWYDVKSGLARRNAESILYPQSGVPSGCRRQKIVGMRSENRYLLLQISAKLLRKRKHTSNGPISLLTGK
jgi:hypothetical protein